MMFVFPYDALGVLALLDKAPGVNTPHRVSTSKMRGLLHARKTESRSKAAERFEQIKTEAVSLGRTANLLHSHFLETDRRCAGLIESGARFWDVASHFCRVMVMDIPEGLSNSPELLMHIGMCGLCVPCFCQVRQ